MDDDTSFSFEACGLQSCFQSCVSSSHASCLFHPINLHHPHHNALVSTKLTSTRLTSIKLNTVRLVSINLNTARLIAIKFNSIKNHTYPYQNDLFSQNCSFSLSLLTRFYCIKPTTTYFYQTYLHQTLYHPSFLSNLPLSNLSPSGFSMNMFPNVPHPSLSNLSLSKLTSRRPHACICNQKAGLLRVTLWRYLRILNSNQTKNRGKNGKNKSQADSIRSMMVGFW